MQGCDFTQYQVSCIQLDNPGKNLSKIKKDIARTSSNKPKL